MNVSFKKILVANRGEIAVRIIRACQELGIGTVAVFSDADANAPHVMLADEAVCLGPSEPSKSYLNRHKLIDAARRTGAQAIHPGYGFLSENATFAAECRDANVTFIGPSAETIERLGSKAAARELAEQNNVPTAKGRTLRPEAHELLSELALREAATIGYPVLLKAAAGGGGKGMRIVDHPSTMQEAIGSAQQEAMAAFGSDLLILEKYIAQPRHIEVQILGDHHGNLVHLGERECSIQRRHQKIIEEAPCAYISESLRARLTRAALAVARAADYVNAGTVEFLVDAQENFYFLEVNTRLQVEHPVTESITGIDLVIAQIRVAQGEPLGFTQNDVEISGHAFECRAYAEDPARHFAPAPGKIVHLELPTMPGIRVDCGVRSQQQIPIHYDPVLFKLVASGETREVARRRMLNALRETCVLGITTNLDFLQAIFADPAFIQGKLDTHYLERHFPSWKPESPTMELIAQAAVCEHAILTSRSVPSRNGIGSKHGTRSDECDAWRSLKSWRIA